MYEFSVEKNIGYRLSLENMTIKQIEELLEEYIFLFGNCCEFKLSEKFIKNEGLNKLNWISKSFDNLQFSVHLPKDIFLSNEFNKDEIVNIISTIGKLRKSCNVNCITHFPQNIVEFFMIKEQILTISYSIPNNITILFENPIVYNNLESYFGFINEFLYELKYDKKFKLGMCLDIGHLLYGINSKNKYKSIIEVYNIILKYDCIFSNIYEIHLHDYDNNVDHKKIGQGFLDVDLLKEFIKKINALKTIILEVNINEPKYDGIEQFNKLKDIVV